MTYIRNRNMNTQEIWRHAILSKHMKWVLRGTNITQVIFEVNRTANRTNNLTTYRTTYRTKNHTSGHTAGHTAFLTYLVDTRN